MCNPPPKRNVLEFNLGTVFRVRVLPVMAVPPPTLHPPPDPALITSELGTSCDTGNRCRLCVRRAGRPGRTASHPRPALQQHRGAAARRHVAQAVPLRRRREAERAPGGGRARAEGDRPDRRRRQPPPRPAGQSCVTLSRVCDGVVCVTVSCIVSNDVMRDDSV